MRLEREREREREREKLKKAFFAAAQFLELLSAKKTYWTIIHIVTRFCCYKKCSFE